MTPTEQSVHDLVVPIAGELGLQIYDVELAGGVLRVLLDTPEGIDMGAITEATKQISRSLDSADPITSSYTLEVSSPGIERTLRTPSHFDGAVGERVKVKTRSDSGLQRRLSGTLESFAGSEFCVRSDDGDEITVGLDQVERVRTEFVDTASPKPGKAKAGTQSSKSKKSNTGNRTDS